MPSILEAMVSDVRAALGSPSVLIGPAHNTRPRFELFNGANSLCSQKVRTVLAHHQITYVSNTVNMFAGQTYLPEYVRLRMVGCERLGIPLMTTHNGSTSVTSGGCDAAVVPTLVDWGTNEVIVDSKRICLYLDDAVREGRLRPQHIREQIDREIDVVDNLPNYQMVIGTPSRIDGRPASVHGDKSSHIAMQKVVERLDRYLSRYASDPILPKRIAQSGQKNLRVPRICSRKRRCGRRTSVPKTPAKTWSNCLRDGRHVGSSTTRSPSRISFGSSNSCV
jgi:2,5-dichlorohydroquinone reductive dechlorinase